MWLREWPYEAEAEEGEGGGEGDGENEGTEWGSFGDDDAAGGKDEEGGEDEGEGEGEGGVAARPSWLPEQFWDGDKGEGRWEQLAKSQLDTRAELNRIKNLDKAVPKTVDGYFEVYKTEGLTDAQLKKIGGTLDGSDPMLKTFAEISLEEGIDANRFQRIANKFMAALSEQFEPGPTIDPAVEMERLGGPQKAKQLHSAVGNWMRSISHFGGGEGSQQPNALSKEEFELVATFAKSATGLSALNKLRLRTGEAPIPISAATGDGVLTPEDCYKLYDDPLAHQEGAAGDSYRRKIDREFLKTFGVDVSGRSPNITAPGLQGNA
jgi:hypothetical protein